MKNAILLAILFLAVCDERVQAHIGDAIYPIYELTDTDLALIDLEDGSVDDWLELVGAPSLVPIDFYIASAESADYDPSDLGYRIWLGWNGSYGRIYVAVERSDNVHVNVYDADDHMLSRSLISNDHIRFMLDGDHSGGQYLAQEGSLEELKQVQHRQAQQYVAIADAPGGNRLGMGGPVGVSYQPATYLGWILEPPFAASGGGFFSEAPILSITEFYVTPFDDLAWDSSDESLVSELRAGQIIGFNLVIGDIDVPPRIERTSGSSSIHGKSHAVHRLSTSWEAAQLAELFVDGILLPAGGSLSAGTAAGNATWGRIKATFRE